MIISQCSCRPSGGCEKATFSLGLKRKFSFSYFAKYFFRFSRKKLTKIFVFAKVFAKGSNINIYFEVPYFKYSFIQKIIFLMFSVLWLWPFTAAVSTSYGFGSRSRTKADPKHCGWMRLQKWYLFSHEDECAVPLSLLLQPAHHQVGPANNFL
jgi:hypothetical protein